MGMKIVSCNVKIPHGFFSYFIGVYKKTTRLFEHCKEAWQVLLAANIGLFS